MVGRNQHRNLPDFFRSNFGNAIVEIPSPGFVYRNGREVDLPATLVQNAREIGNYRRGILTLKNIVDQVKPDLVLNFLEPMTGVFKLLYNDLTPVLSIGHQFMMWHPCMKGAGNQGVQEFAMRRYLGVTGTRSRLAGLSFAREEDVPNSRLFVCPPLLRSELFSLRVCDGDYLLVYLVNDGYESGIIEWHRSNRDVPIHCFYDKKGMQKVNRVDATLTFHALDGELFLQMMAGCRGVACTAGFESVCEAAYFGKPLLMVPIENHVEQRLNAQDAQVHGLGIAGKDFDLSPLLQKKKLCATSRFQEWVNGAEERFLKLIEETEQFT